MSTLDERLDDFRHVFAQMVIARSGARSPAIRAAFERVPRHQFVGAGPWYVTEDGDPTPTNDPALVYQDVAMALVPERGITTGLPSLHARCFDACAIHAGETVVHVGAGAGYFSAILAELVGSTGRVYAYEIDAPLAERARASLSALSQVSVSSESGVTVLPAGVDLIYVCAGLQQLPRPWIEALSERGRIACPLTPGSEEGGMLKLERTADPQVLRASFICRARFVPCIGAQNPEANVRLAAAFRSGTHREVRSLRLDTPPDETAWFSGDTWWLSTADCP
jgi:protein-L-isoaspartate(D-aspartate) O-methyltransferase